ncbi:Tetratricopeptide repeat (TPR)-like superfamily protein [Raphanus sativus]|uniref:Pentatricopeptide repeat-containing protein At4g21170 n=1 Tax=Raphanus sativus TaxID=3726 RepID=A0A6J0MEP1_RAPSA|nr:pentatricopeptide repeat-containing protein At4g21170 [Raphanus sativus]KAJ4912789.1 Tetratricopeptide repeat (TPR)-like superfamily protein [Raphanus sativus]
MVLLHKSLGLVKRFSTSSTSSASEWKTQQTLFRSATEISSILLQRRNWNTHLRYVKSKLPRATLTPPLFLHILRETRNSPKTALEFFDWAKTHLRFEPDLKSHCRVIEVAAEAGLLERAEALLRPLVETHSASMIVGSMQRWFEGEEGSLSVSLSLALECYVSKSSSYQNGLEVFSSMRRLRLSLSVSAYNSLLDSLVKEKQFGVALCLYCAMVRNGAVSDGFTYDLLAQVLCEHGRHKSVVKLMETGVESRKIYTSLVECYSRNGEFVAAFGLIREMDDKKLELSFSSYGCVLDDVCRFGDAELIDKVLVLMVERDGSIVDDEIIERLCEMGKTFASEMLFRRACNAGTVRYETYGCMLKSLSRNGRRKEAVDVYRMICRKGVWIHDESCYTEFANALCIDHDDDDDDTNSEELLVDVINRGYVPCTRKLSEVLAAMCRKRRWNQAEKLLDSVMEMEVYFDSFSCGLLMERYCRTGKLEKAMVLHEKIKKMKGSLDVNAYNAVLDRLMTRQRTMVEEAVGVFEYMKEMSTMNSRSFAIMIHGLCRVKEMKKAMKYHDEMLKLGLKPDLASYKRLILGFK